MRVDPMQAGTPAFEAAILKVLTDPHYSQTASALSARVIARKDTPLQEAGGAPSFQHICFLWALLCVCLSACM